jgi:hypothetical protein
MLPARRTTPPIDDLGFVDLETVIIVRGEARRRPDRAIDVEHAPAASADQVMMIVTNSILVPGRGPGRLDPANKVLIDQDPEGVIDRLPGDRPDDRPDVFNQLVGRGVGTRRHGAHNREPLCGDLQSVLAE